MQNYEENTKLPKLVGLVVKSIAQGNERMNRALEKSVGLRWKRCGRSLLFSDI